MSVAVTGKAGSSLLTTRSRIALHPIVAPKSQPPPQCKVYTPKDLADAMVRTLNPEPSDRWLDPCMGPGVFVAALRDCGMMREQIVGVDIDGTPSPADSWATTRRGVDFFDWCHTTTQRFTKIIANPPYVALSKLGADLRSSVHRLGRREDPSFSLRANYWCAFLAACLDVLAADGSLAFLLPAAWEYASYASALRKRIMSSFRRFEVHRSLEPLFPDVREGSVVVVGRGYLQPPEHSDRADYPSSATLIAALSEPAKANMTRIAEYATWPASSTAFGDLFSVGIGCVTGDVDYFLLTEPQRLEWNLPVSTLRPVVSRARHLTASKITKAIWQRMLRDGERVWLFSPDRNAEKYKAIRAYLRHGEMVCDLDGYKLRNRDPWYRIPGIFGGAGFVSGMTGIGPWIAQRSMRNLVATNTLYVVSPKERITREEQAAWFLSLLTTETRDQAATHTRRYPDGLAKFEPRDISRLRLPSPKRIPGSRERYHRAIKLLLSGNIQSAIEIADASVGQKPRSRKPEGRDA